MKEDFFYLGLITKPFGFKGQLYLYLDTDEPEKYANLRAVFLAIGGEYLPYMIEEMNLLPNKTAIVKFVDVDGEEAKSLVKSELYLPMSELPPLTGNNFYYHEVTGFSVIDVEKGNIGTCKEFIDVSSHAIMVVEAANGCEILIPAIDEIFETVNRADRQLHICAPEGLIDIYLQPTIEA